MATIRSGAVETLGKTASDLARRWAAQRVAAVQGYGRILAEYGNGRASGRDTAQAYARLAMQEATRYPTDAFQLATDYAAAVARAAGLSLKTEPTASVRSPVIDIDVAGVIGRVAKRTFVLENPHDAPASISFSATHFHDAEEELEAVPTFAPARVSIPAGGEKTITISVKIDRKQFQAGRTYRSNVAVEGFDDMVIRVHLTVAGAP